MVVQLAYTFLGLVQAWAGRRLGTAASSTAGDSLGEAGLVFMSGIIIIWPISGYENQKLVGLVVSFVSSSIA